MGSASSVSANFFFDDDDIPGSFRCPITLDLLRDPVILGSTGHTFERKVIETWLERRGVDPLSNQQIPLNERKLIPNLALRDAIEDFLQRISGRIISSSDLVIGEKLGSGAEKEVYQGMMKGKKVAILRIRQASLTSAEARMFVRLGCHPHLVRFIGRAHVDISPNASNSISEPNALIVELASCGDLSSYMSRSIDNNSNDGGLTPSTLSLVHRLLIAEQVADGMTAVHAAGIIHRDLAARNIMVFSMNVDDPSQTLVKVSDYGIAAATGSDGYLQTGGTTRAPIRWMPPETIRRRTWSFQSDIWAFGILLWEVFTDGEFPYGMIGNDEDVALKVCDGSLRLTRPDSCPADVWALVERCWAEERERRPPFTELRLKLQQLRAQYAPDLAVNSLNTRLTIAQEGASLSSVDGSSTTIHRTESDEFSSSNVPGRGVITFENGDCYTGEVRGGRRHGQGKCVYANGDIYEGEWGRDLRCGVGSLTTSRAVYKGEFRDNKMIGSGRIAYSNGDTYEGDWRDGDRHGVGTFVAAGNAVTSTSTDVGSDTSTQSSDIPAVQSSATSDNQPESPLPGGGRSITRYEGNWLADQINGTGTCFYSNRDKYEGSFLRGLRSGPGRLIEPDGVISEGQWLDDMLCGSGIRKYTNGDVFEGIFQNGKRHGKGRLKYCNNNVLESEWASDQRIEKGKVTYATGDVYEGELAISEVIIREGIGKLEMANGDVYVGGFANDLFNGLGEYRAANGQSRKGQWVSGKPKGGGPCHVS